MGISDKIEAFITELLKEEDSWLELRRNELASVFNCVPSQINYVISTRFTPQNGYVVESRRGGGGYLRIKKLNTEGEEPVYQAILRIGPALDYQSAQTIITSLVECRAIDPSTGTVMLAAVSDRSLSISQPEKNLLRASVLKNMLSVCGSHKQ